MSEIHIPWLAGAQYFKVVCRLGINKPDTTNDLDSYPNLTSQGGTVQFRAGVSKFRYMESDGRSRMVYTVSDTYNIQTATGELFDVDGNIGVFLLDTSSPGVDPQGFTYTATVRPNVGEPFTVVIPGSQVENGIIDLVDHVSIAPSSGTSSLDSRVTILEQTASSGGSGMSAEDVQDIVGEMVINAGGSYNDNTGDVVFPGGSGSGVDAEGVQDVVGAMVVQAGGTYDDADGTITLPSGGGATPTVVDWVTLTQTGQAITLPAPTQGEQRVVVLTQDSTGGWSAAWPAGVIWEGGVTPSVPVGASERAVVTLLGTGAEWLGFTSGTFTAPVTPDTTDPTPGSLASSLITQTGFRLTVTGAGDDRALAVLPYSFSTDNGATWSAWQADPAYDASGLTAGTSYTCVHQTRDAAGNIATGASIQVATLAASVPAISDSFNRADNATGLGQTDTGQTWQQVGTGIVGIKDNMAYRATSNALAVVDFGQADMWVTHKVAVTADYFAGSIARYVDANNHYSFETSSAGGTGMVKVMRTIAGSSVSVAGAAIPSVASGDTIGVSFKEVGGSTEIKTYKNGTLIATATDSTAGRPMGTKAGLKPWNNGTIRLDDFSVQVPT